MLRFMRKPVSVLGTWIIAAIVVASVAWWVKYRIDANRASNGLQPKYPCLVQREPDQVSWVLCNKVKYGSKLYYSMEEAV